ncbi:MAG TPA: hypothetical protein VM285_06375 [Polyangia bacterium]|nr:hypothetical protein [Polyangia bacterium]
MKTWEYRVIDSNDVAREGLFTGRSREAIEGYLNGLGAEGWEVVNVDFRELESRSSFTGVAKRAKS